MKSSAAFSECELLTHWPRSSSWTQLLADQFELSEWASLSEFVTRERSKHEVFPVAGDVFRALELTGPDQVRFVVLGQDPYHGSGQAHGLSFSVPDGVDLPPSLKNIFRELGDDTGRPQPARGDLSAWARQGGLLLNTVLTVRGGQANSHRRQGWESFTDAIIQRTSEHCDHVAFVLWGKPAQRKKSLIDESKHLVIQSPHPSPLSAHRGFFGSRPFSTINDFLLTRGLPAIDW
ncbi:MAG: uracil-DNA glycosylase [Pirellulaceae bacterium]